MLSRLKNYPHDNYLYLGSILKGVAVYFAALVGLDILWKRKFWMIVPWIAAFAAINVSYMKWGRGILLTNSRANLFDTLFPLGMGLVEFSLFALLAIELFLPVHTDQQRPPWFRWWFLALSMHGFLAVALVLNRLYYMNIETEFEQPLAAVASKLKSWMWADVGDAAAVGIGSLIVWVALSKKWFQEKGALIAAAIAAVVLFCVALQADSERRSIDSELTKLESNVSTTP